VELEGVRLIREQKEEVETTETTPTDSEGSPKAAASSKKPEPKPAPSEPPSPDIEHAHVSVSLLRLLFGTQHITFGAEAFGGEMAGMVSKSDDSQEIRLEIENMGVTNMPMLADVVGLPMTGALTGSIELAMPEGKATNTEGTVAFTIDSLTVGDGKAKVLKAITLPKVGAGTVTFDAEAAGGILKIKELKAKGKDLTLEADGKIRFRDPLESSLLEVNLKFKFSDAYKNKNDMTRGLFGDPNSGVPGILELDPKVRRSKQPDGFYAWTARGPLGKPTINPGAGRASTRSSKSTRRRTTRRGRQTASPEPAED
jgi:type II secretion system protein N